MCGCGGSSHHVIAVLKVSGVYRSAMFFTRFISVSPNLERDLIVVNTLNSYIARVAGFLLERCHPTRGP